MEDSNQRSDACTEVGRKRAHGETIDLNSSLSENNKDFRKTKQTIAEADIERSVMASNSKASYSNHQGNNWLKLDEAREENERLKNHLSKMMNDYEALQMQFVQVVKQEEKKKSTEENDDEVETQDELVSLRLGRFSSNTDSNCKKNNFSQEEEKKTEKRELSLGLECKFETSESDVNVEDEVVQQKPLKKARVCVRVRCDTPTMKDGCQWRKYGQKFAKGNPCPRAYYRCTVAPFCPVRKQVQRCVEDRSILVSTYEGAHNHTLPLSATAMASTTSAAASMLLSNSSFSTSRSNGLNPSIVIRTTPDELHNLNFHSNPKHFFLQNSSLSPSPSHPTITLDLTNSTPSSSHFNRFSSSTLSFSSTTNEPNWSNGYFGYGNTNRSHVGGINTGRSSLENDIFRAYMKSKNSPIVTQQQDSSSIAAATKAIVDDPSFQSALEAALSSIMGQGGGKLKWGDHFPVASGGYCPPAAKGNACASSYFNKTTDGSMGLPAYLPFVSPKRNDVSSLGDSKDNS